MTIKQKNTTLVISFFGVLLLGYFLSISVTLSLKKNYDTLKTQEQIYSNIPKRLQILSQKERYYDSLLQHYQITETSLQNNLLKTIDRYAINHNIKIISFDEPHSVIQNGKKTNSYAFRVSGDFNAILGLAYQLEQRSKFGMIASLEFEKLKNYRTGQTTLEGAFVLQLVQ
ncbi:hypothetical protein ACFO3O_21335 [Dokdonia ponticola]|uniref:General secretion pathway protein n=1 Tax=Dokdonia ponticola TaxID=2041041 RepID=A0ABV9I2B5_9FLAO